MSSTLTKIEIWPYCDLDRAGVVALWNEAFADPRAHNLPDLVITRKMAVQRGLFFVALVDGRVVGTTMAGYDGVRGWLHRVAVSKSYRRQGIGRSLVEHAVRALKAMGCAKVNLQVRADHAEAEAFYASLGFGVEDRVSMGLTLKENV